MRVSMHGAAAALWLVLMAVGLQACGGSDSGEPAPGSSVTADEYSVNVTVERGQVVLGRAITLTLHDTTVDKVHLFGDYSHSGIDHVTYQEISDTELRVRFFYVDPGTLVNGSYSDSVYLYFCSDEDCKREISGSPVIISSNYTVTGIGGGPNQPADPVTSPVVPSSRITLSHNVLDAEYSRSLDRIVMAASYPANALYVYDVASGTEKSVALNKTPTSVSLSPDGQTVAVGHDALISVINVATVGQAGAPAPILLNVSADVFDLVLDGLGRVHVFPRTDQWVVPHSIDIATNTETLGSFGLRAGSHARLHPSGSYIYSADNGLSPSDIEKWDISSGVATGLYDSPYHGDYAMCGDLWFNQSGTRIFTRCGNSFRADTVRSQDMIYTGRLAMATDYSLVWLDQFEARKEIALIETSQPWGCQVAGTCFTHLGIFDSDFLTQKSVYSIAPMVVSGNTYAQRGLFVFYRSNGSSKFLLSRLEGMPNPAAEYYLSVLD